MVSFDAMDNAALDAEILAYMEAAAEYAKVKPKRRSFKKPEVVECGTPVPRHDPPTKMCVAFRNWRGPADGRLYGMVL